MTLDLEPITQAVLAQRSRHTVEDCRDELLAVSHALHADPETSFAEHRAAAALAQAAEDAGFTVRQSAYGLDTAFEAVYGDGDFRVVVCAEYDALPGIGHACGHNVIAAASLGAARGLASVADELGLQVVLLGTPAEEHGGGKVVLLERGAWEGAAVSVMAHGAPGAEDVSCRLVATQAVERFDVTFEGRAAHAAAAPHEAINAGDAATLALVAIGLLRQQLRDGIRLNAFVADGGDVTNIIPSRTVVSAEVRAFDLDTLADTRRRMMMCFAGAALATGCRWSSAESEPTYQNLVQHPALADAWDASLREQGRRVSDEPRSGGGSTDMGNVSQVVPAIHPMITLLGTDSAPHTVEFARDAATPAADDAVVAAAIGLAQAVITVAADPIERAYLLEGLAARSDRLERSASESTRDG